MKHTSVALLIGLLFGLAIADYIVSGQCSDDGSHIKTASIADGNCTPMGSGYYELIETSHAGDLIAINYCQDQLCKTCFSVISYPVETFVDCKTTPKFRYTTTSDPESDLVKMIGGTVFVTADTYDNCTSVLKRSYTPANVCISSPKDPHSSGLISCKAGNQWGSIFNYSDDKCQQQISKNTIWTGGCQEGEKYFHYCLSASN